MARHGWFLATTNWERELGAPGLSYGLVILSLPVGAVMLAGVFDHLSELNSGAAPEPDPEENPL